MNLTRKLRFLLVSGGLIAVAIGATLLLSPATLHASYGTDLGSDVNLLSEIRAPGGALLVFGALMLLGAWNRRYTFAATLITAALYLSYGAARLVSIGLDGVPHTSLIGGAAIELVLGVAAVFALKRSPALR